MRRRTPRTVPMPNHPLRCARAVAMAAAMALLAGAAHAQTWPQRPVRILVPTSPPGGADFVARLIAPPLGERIGRNNLLTFDMGGTTAKSAVVQDGVVSFDSLYYVNGFEHGYPVQTSVVDVVEVGAGEIGRAHV